MLKGCYWERQREGGGGFPERQGRPEPRGELLLAGEWIVPRQLGQAAAAGAGFPGEVWVKVME